jgi:AcrR family transcriptional regulator
MAATVNVSSRVLRERSILRATLEELDYGALSIDSVAKRAGVNKTTVYRRWPTKADLVGSALTALADQMTLGPSAGSLRADLLEIGRRMLNLALSLEGQGLARLGILRSSMRSRACGRDARRSSSNSCHRRSSAESSRRTPTWR